MGRSYVVSVLVLVTALWTACDTAEPTKQRPGSSSPPSDSNTAEETAGLYVGIDRDIPLGEYFDFIQGIVAAQPALEDSILGEYLLVRANPWLIEALAATDYYALRDRGVTSLDPQAETVLRAGDSLLIPDDATADSLLSAMERTVLDINVPEFMLRVVEGGRTIFEFPIRVGQPKEQYLAMAGRTVDLRTHVGDGSIVRIERNPRYVNPRDNHEYFQTRRDDGVLTKLPRIPFLEPELDGIRYGQLIHPTTNPETLGRAYSNGCIGMAEGDAWYTYYHAPIGTRVTVRYDLEVLDPVTGGTSRLPDIYSRWDGGTGGPDGAGSGGESVNDPCVAGVS